MDEDDWFDILSIVIMVLSILFGWIYLSVFGLVNIPPSEWNVGTIFSLIGICLLGIVTAIGLGVLIIIISVFVHSERWD
jgi:hypothetical protein